MIEEHIRLLKEDVDIPNLEHGRALGELPEWFDKEKFKRGQKFFADNYYALFVSKLCGLLVTLSMPRVLKILMMTQRSSKPHTAFKRYFSTISHMLLWYNGDILDKNSWAFKSLTEVYTKHAAANKRGLNEKTGSLSQSSLALTQFGFMGFGVLMPHKLGIVIDDPKDLEGFIHFWRTIGYLIGVDDRYNICRGNVEETRELCRRMLEEIFWPLLKTPSKDFTEMTTALLHGMWAIIPFIDVEGFMSFTYSLAGLEVNPFSNWYSSGIYNFQKFIHETLLTNWFFGRIARIFLNFEMWLAVLITSKFPFLAHLSLGMPISGKMDY
ncbi:UNVERIFIED_CONTAM: hypothetical protein PYX00_007064 [Menopon gallinae]|uniref:ER-bound oxygenase mpaB/mpaB'/Rubber oxygenase catalytic domain-containing protein n=1 Tax=Menopon gallinae TaxID=328185 RepID=A0AAW2HHN2_9NEOP